MGKNEQRPLPSPEKFSADLVSFAQVNLRHQGTIIGSMAEKVEKLEAENGRLMQVLGVAQASLQQQADTIQQREEQIKALGGEIPAPPVPGQEGDEQPESPAAGDETKPEMKLVKGPKAEAKAAKKGKGKGK